MLGGTAIRRYVASAPDRRLERTLGSAAGQRLLLSAMARRFDPAAAEGFTGEIAFALRREDGRERVWTVAAGPGGATLRPGRGEPALTVRASAADVVRMAAGELDAGGALLAGRLDLEGDFALATRLGAMFRLPGVAV
jgi:hypothetical protein